MTWNGLLSKKQTEQSAAILLSGCAAIEGRIAALQRAMKTNQLVDNTATAKTTMIEADQFSPTADAIAVLAYRYWTERDGSNGSPEEDWLRAENEIKHKRTPGSVV